MHKEALLSVTSAEGKSFGVPARVPSADRPRLSPAEAEALAERLTLTLQRAGMSYYAAAKEAGLTQPMVSRLARGERTSGVSLATMFRLADATGEDRAYLILGIGEPRLGSNKIKGATKVTDVGAVDADERYPSRAGALGYAMLCGIDPGALDVVRGLSPAGEDPGGRWWVEQIRRVAAERLGVMDEPLGLSDRTRNSGSTANASARAARNERDAGRIKR